MKLMRKKRLRHTKTKTGAFFWLLATSYIAFLFIMFLCVLVLYAYAENLISREAEKSNTSILLNIKYSIDSKFDALKNYTFSTINDMSCIQFAEQGQLDKTDERSLTAYIKRQEVYNSYASNIYISSYRSGRTISYDGVWQSDYLYDVLFSESLSRQEYNDLRNKPVMAQFFVYEPTTFGSERKSIGCISSYFKNDIFSKPYGDATALIDAAKLAEEVNPSNGSVLYLVDENQNIVLAAGEEGIPLPPQEYIRPEETTQIDRDGEAFVISTFVSDVTPWTYVYLSPKGEYWESSRKLQFITLFVFLAFLAIGILAVIYFSNKNSVPVKRLISELGITNEDKNNEFTLISHYAKELMAGKSSLEKQLQSETHIVRDTLIRQILSGHIQSGDTTEKLADSGILFSGSYFTVVLCQIEDFSALYHCATEGDFAKAENNINFLLGNVGIELYSEFSTCYSASIEHYYAFIICTDEAVSQKIYATAKTLRDFFLNQLNVQLSLSISDTCDNTDSISNSYRSAVQAMDYCFILGGNSVISSEEPMYFIQSYQPDEERKEKFLLDAKSGDIKMTLQDIDDMFADTLNNRVTLEGCKAFTFDMISMTITLTYELNAYTHERDTQIKNLISCDTMDEIRILLKQYMESLIMSIKESSNNRNLSMVVLHYIEQNYQNPDLNVDAVGQYMNMAPSYISKVFKEQIGTPLSSYLQLIRISAAKKLLQNTSSSVESIATKVGYSSGNSLIRTFKRYEGMTPGQYKTLCRENKPE